MRTRAMDKKKAVSSLAARIVNKKGTSTFKKDGKSAVERAGLSLHSRSKGIKKVAVKAGTGAVSLTREKYNKKFQFFYSRTCFRGMLGYYQSLHHAMKSSATHPKQVLQNVEWPETQKMIRQLLSKDLGLDDVVSGKVGTELETNILVLTMMMILFAHRHLKNDKYILQADELIKKLDKASEPAHGLKPFLNGTADEESFIASKDGNVLQMKWDVIRDCSYKYSKRAQDRFLEYFFEAYFFARFGLSPLGVDFVLNKEEDMCNEKRLELEQEMKVLTQEAVNAVERMAGSEANPLSPALTARLLRDVRQQD